MSRSYYLLIGILILAAVLVGAVAFYRATVKPSGGPALNLPANQSPATPQDQGPERSTP